MSEFTQGKWEAVFSSLGEYPYYVTTNSEGNYHQVAFVDTEANARLIAAAPEMYQHLKLILNGEFSSDDVEQLMARIDGEE